MNHLNKIIIGEEISLRDVIDVARNYAYVELSESAKKKVKRSREIVEKLLREEERCYGVTTGFGPLSRVAIGAEKAARLQRNIILSHSVGVGKPLSTDITRAAMFLRLNSLAKGHSGVRLEVIERIIKMLNERIHPVIPEKGSVGASGDLAPLAHMALAIIGDERAQIVEGEIEKAGESDIVTGSKVREVLEKHGINPIDVSAKEGLALVNGTSVMTAILALTVYDSYNVVKAADIALAMSMEAISGFTSVLDEEYLKLRNYPHSITSANNVMQLLKGSKLVSLRELRKTVHDPYSIRCAPAVHGSVRYSLEFAREIVEIEINSVNDNPLFFESEPHCRSGGHFHGQPIALASDVLGIGLTTLGNISERRINLLMTPELIWASGKEELSSFLIPKGKEGLHSGFMIAQYTAAALAAENRTLSNPASVHSIPTSENFEDFVSMGATAARKARSILENTAYIIAIELISAAQAIDMRDPDKAGFGTKKAYEIIRRHVSMVDKDRPLYRDVEKIKQLVLSGELIRELERNSKIKLQ